MKWFLLLTTFDLVPKEAQNQAPLEFTAPFDEFWTRQRFRKLSKNPSALDEIAAEVAKCVVRFAADQETRRETATAKLKDTFSGQSPAQVSIRWWTQADAQITDWMTDYLVDNRERLGLSEDRDAWPPPRALQTAWAIHAYHMARIVMNVGLLRAIGNGDAHDAHHYASACYADIFVTEDSAFRETLKIIPNSPVTVLSFDDFASQVGLAPH